MDPSGAQANEGDYNRILQVCRSCTVDPLALASMASLTYIRTMLLALIFPVRPHADFAALLSFFRDRVDIEGANGVSHLQNLQSSFDVLKSEAIDKQTRSEGVKACMDLKDLSDGAEFAIRIGDGVPLSQVCEYLVFN